jgi:aminopeptidase N
MAGLFDKKKSAMPKDSKNSHPLVTPVPGTDECYDVFDSITYRKGAGAVKQLMFLMGESSFQEGISEYLHRYEWSAADTGDFFAIMQKYYSSPALSLN